MVFHFIILVLIHLISCLFSGGITISSTFLEFSSDTGFGSQFFQQFCILSIHLLLQLFYGFLFWKQFSQLLVQFLQQYSLIFSHICWINFWAWQKSISFDIFSCSWFYKVTCHFFILISNVNLTLSSISNGLPFWSVNAMMV